MKFDDKWSDNCYKEYQFEGSSLIRSEIEGQCFMCKEMTKWIDISFHGHLCSEECSRNAWEEASK